MLLVHDPLRLVDCNVDGERLDDSDTVPLSVGFAVTDSLSISVVLGLPYVLTVPLPETLLVHDPLRLVDCNVDGE